MRHEPAYQLKSVDRALLLIHLLRDQGSVTVTEAADVLGVGASTAHRLLTALAYRDFAIQDERRAYLAGPAISVDAGPGERVARLRAIVEPHLGELRDATRETVNLSIRVGGSVRVLAAAVSPQALRVADQVGTILPAVSTAAGRVQLAHLEPATVLGLLRGADVPGTRDPARLLAELHRVRAEGHAVNRGEAEADVSAVAVALRGAGGRVQGALAVVMPSARLKPADVAGIAARLTAAAREIEVDLADDETSPDP